jgi:RecA/RadA recombinase
MIDVSKWREWENYIPKNNKMAKKKKDYKSMTEEQLNAEIEVAKEAKDAENLEGAQKELKMRKFKEESSKKMEKKFLDLNKYKEKINYKAVSYKPQDWIDMSPAFKEVTMLPGIPLGHTIMCYGKSDTGKSTLGIEAAAYAQKQGIVPVFIITENKFSFERAEKMGVDMDNAIIYNGLSTIEEGCDYIKQTLDDQENGKLPFDVVFIWDSVGATPSKAEHTKREEEENGGGGMMVTAKVLRERITRYLARRINDTRNETYPYMASLIIINHAYEKPPSPPATIGSIVPYGGDGIYLAATLVFRQGGVTSRSSKVTAIKEGTEVAFALRSALIVEKNHITNVSTTKGKILCTDGGFLRDDKAAIEEYKERTKSGWDLRYDKFWDDKGGMD